MVLNRNLARRRRLMVDASTPLGEAVSQPTSTPPESDPARATAETRAYALAAQRRHQRKITDLIPKRPWACATAAVGSLGLLGVLNLLSWQASGWEGVLGASGVAGLGLWGAGTLGGWCAGVILLLSAAVCWQIYLMRQHKRDDYEGTYRVWIAGTLVFLVAAAASSIDVLGPLARVSGYLTGISFVDPAWLPVAIGMVLLGFGLTRYLLEVRRSYGTIAWTVVGWLGLAVAVAHPLWAPAIGDGDTASLVLGNALWTATLGWFLGQLTYARFVYLRANGLVSSAAAEAAPAKAKKKKKEKVRKQPKPAKAKPANESTEDDRQEDNAEEAAAPAAAKPRTEPKRKLRRKSVEPPVEVASEVAAPEPVKPAAPAPVEPPAPPTRKVNSDASEKLKQLAAASRARQQAAEVSDDADDDDDELSSGKLSKSQRRKLRRAERKAKRAA